MTAYADRGESTDYLLNLPPLAELVEAPASACGITAGRRAEPPRRKIRRRGKKAKASRKKNAAEPAGEPLAEPRQVIVPFPAAKRVHARISAGLCGSPARALRAVV